MYQLIGHPSGLGNKMPGTLTRDNRGKEKGLKSIIFYREEK